MASKKILRIRFNTENTGTLLWRCVIDGKEYLADNVNINVPTFNTTDTLPDGRIKYHFSCYYNILDWENNNLTVN